MFSKNSFFEIICHYREISFSVLENFKIEVEKGIKVIQKKYNRDLDWISLSFITEEEIIQLNEQFLQKKSPTDVLSFPYHKKGNNIQGDILFCYSYVANSFQEDFFHQKENVKNKKINYYVYETIIHGILHLFGLEHDYSEESLKKVYQIQHEIIKNITIEWKKIDEFITEIIS